MNAARAEACASFGVGCVAHTASDGGGGEEAEEAAAAGPVHLRL